MNFKMYDCDFGLSINGVTYEFEHVDTVTIDDPEVVTLTRGSNKKNKEGIIITEGSKDPKTIATTLVGVSGTLFDVMKATFEAKTRIEFYCISRADGSSVLAKQAVLSKQPRQSQISEDAESLNVMVELKSFDLQEVHKS